MIVWIDFICVFCHFLVSDYISYLIINSNVNLYFIGFWIPKQEYSSSKEVAVVATGVYAIHALVLSLCAQRDNHLFIYQMNQFTL